MLVTVLETTPERAIDAAPIGRPTLSLRRRVIFSLVAFLLALAAALAVAEIALRICGFGHNYTNPMGSFFTADGEIGCRGKANFTGRFRRTDFDVTIQQDENGFRRGDPVTAKDSRDVYVLGDSFVWGYGIDQRDLLTNQMARRLGRPVHNLGLIGAGTVQEYLIFQKHVAARLKPGDVVVLLFFGNDFGDNVGQHLQGRLYAKLQEGHVELVPPAPASDMRQWKNWMKDVSYLFNLASYCIDRFQDRRSTRSLGDRATRRIPPPEQIQTESGDRSPAVQITRHYLAALRDECRAKQARFLAVFVPGQGELGEDDVTSTNDLSLPEEIACRQAFERAAGELGLVTVDLMAPMIAAKRSGRFPRLTFVHDFHWNAAGNTVAAEVIAEKVR
jgi:lysophospholipase L1-like esterase